MRSILFLALLAGCDGGGALNPEDVAIDGGAVDGASPGSPLFCVALDPNDNRNPWSDMPGGGTILDGADVGWASAPPALGAVLALVELPDVWAHPEAAAALVAVMRTYEQWSAMSTNIDAARAVAANAGVDIHPQLAAANAPLAADLPMLAMDVLAARTVADLVVVAADVQRTNADTDHLIAVSQALVPDGGSP